MKLIINTKGHFKNLTQLVAYIHEKSGYGKDCEKCVKTLRIVAHGNPIFMNLGHGVNDAEINEVRKFILQKLPDPYASGYCQLL